MTLGRLLALAGATCALAACGGGDDAAAPTVAVQPPPASPTTTGEKAAAAALADSMRAAGLQPVAQPPPAEVGDAVEYLVVPAGRTTVYVVGFASIAEARRYARVVADQVRAAKGTLLARRAGPRLYIATASRAGRRPLARQVLRVIRAGEGADVRPVRVGPS